MISFYLLAQRISDGAIARVISDSILPEGWKIIDAYHGYKVYDDDGVLDCHFWAVKRIEEYSE